MAHEKILRLMLALERRTAAGTIAWEETDREGVFQAVFPGQSVRILERAGHRGTDVILRIYNENGAVVEEVTDPDLEGVDLPAPWEDAFELMKSIYDGARRKAMRIDEVLDDIIGRLEEGP